MNPLLTKIRALRELARRNDNPNEAAAAAAQAERLCQEHRISEATLDAAGPVEGPTVLEVDQWDRIDLWRSYLLSDLAKLHGCALVYLRPEGKRGYEAVAYGDATDLEVLKELYEWHTAEIERLAATIAKSPRAYKSFCVGASEGIREAMAEAEKAARRTATSSALAIVDARLAAAQKALRQKYKRVDRADLGAPKVDAKAFEAGLAEGRRLSEHKAREGRKALR